MKKAFLGGLALGAMATAMLTSIEFDADGMFKKGKRFIKKKINEMN